ncbi:TolC family protein [Stigmatella aurantiaca]|uniref:Outer membrane efflux protein n=1 Tax=Stigmatella aurantiaca (strain DW4/3-1) TaxID=378806 RepID=Q08N90_STIAD|nr:TolC family protein [Stigmatella aurantiaca]ADO72338.1 Outer membrane efflux protein domain protein [Stigmatella aurantiaca DW4/3-1]EAU61948.1 outer membrane efflux protein [Stigmatella aurantiaca DW4/3-1]
MFIRTFLSGLLLTQAPTASDAPVNPSTEASAPSPETPSSTTPPALPVLSFEQAIALAEKQNPSLEAARARLRQADELSSKAWSGYLPNLTANGSYTRQQEVAIPLSPDAPPIVIQQANQLGAQVTLRQALIVPQLWPAIQNAYLGERITALTVENTRRELLFAVAQAYLGAASLRDSLAVQEQLLAVRRGFEHDAQVRFQVGDVERIALLRATLDRKQAEQELIRSRNAYATARSALAALLARPVDFDVAPPQGPEVAVPAEAANPETAEQTALDKRLDVGAARLAVDSARLGRRQYVFQYFPNLYATANFSASNAAGLTGQTTIWNAGLALSWTLFDGGLREANIREASGKIAEANANLRGAEHKARDEVRKATFDLESAEANLSTAEERVKIARESARLTKESFEAGAATYLQVTDINASLAGAELSAVAEALNVRLSRLALARSMGLFDPTGNTLAEPSDMPETQKSPAR